MGESNSDKENQKMDGASERLTRDEMAAEFDAASTDRHF